MNETFDRRRFLAGFASTIAAGSLLSACSGSSSSTQPTGDDTILYRPSDWLAGSGKHGSTRLPITQTAQQGPGRLSVHRSRVRITADPRYPTKRECFVLNSTEGVEDSEIFSTWYPAAKNGHLPQMGHVHRASDGGAIVVDQDVLGWTTTWLSVWSWDGSRSPTAFGKIPATTGTSDYPVIVGWQRPKADPRLISVYLNHAGGIDRGDKIRIVGTGVAALDGDWTVHRLLKNAASVAMATGPLILLEDAAHASVVPYTPVRGLVEFQGMNPKELYPCHVRSRVIGNLAQAKKWNARVPEPPWEPGVYTGGQAWELDLSKLSHGRVPRSGKCGILANHLQPGGHVDYDDITISDLS